MPDNSFKEETSDDPPSQNDTKNRVKGPDEMFCSSCGEVIKEEAEICPECGVRQGAAIEEKNPGIAAVLSFLWTGLGQVYNGQIMKGIGLITLQMLNVVLMVLLIGFITFPITWLYGVYDAHKTSKRINAGEVSV